MTDYTKTTNFTAKDSLPDGNAAKVIKGSEFDTEFDAIETAIATKEDSSNITTVLRVMKSADEDKTNDATVANDTELSVVLTAGTWDIDMVLSLSRGAGGFQFDLAYTGTITWADASFLEIGNATALDGQTFASPGDGPFTLQVSTTFPAIHYRGAISVSTGGTLTLQWAQASSNAAVTGVNRGSSLIATDMS